MKIIIQLIWEFKVHVFRCWIYFKSVQIFRKIKATISYNMRRKKIMSTDERKTDRQTEINIHVPLPPKFVCRGLKTDRNLSVLVIFGVVVNVNSSLFSSSSPELQGKFQPVCKLGTKHTRVKGIQVCSNERPRPFHGGDYDKIAKILLTKC